MSFIADIHFFYIETLFVSAKSGDSSYFVGQELDISVKYLISKGLTSELGADMFLANEDWKDESSDLSTLDHLTLKADL